MARSQVSILTAFSILSLLVLLVPWPGIVLSIGARELHIHARQYAFTPGVIRVRQGDRVTIALESDDVAHGLQRA